jgi:hypothetical protein
MDVLDIAKSVNQSAALGLDQHFMGLDRGHFHDEITKRAESARLPNQSKESAYVAVLETEEGKQLYKAMRAAPAPRSPQQDFVDPKPEPATDAERELDRLARQVARTANISMTRAKGRVLQDPQHKKLVSALMAAEQRASAEVKRQRSPIWQAQESHGQSWRLGYSAGSARN